MSGKKKMKGKTMDLTNFLQENGGVGAGFTIVAKKQINWEDEETTIVDIGGSLVLPTSSISSRGGLVDETKIPNEGPFLAQLSNLPFDAEENEIANFLGEVKLAEIDIVRDSANRPRGIAQVTFEDRKSLIAALNRDGDNCRSRPVKIQLPCDVEDRYGGFGSRDRGGFGSRGDRGGERAPERDLPTDWRAAPREGQSSFSSSRGGDRGGYGGDRYGGDRDRGYGGDRDRGFGGDRERDMGGDWRSGGGGMSRGGGGGFGDRDRGGSSSRYEPPRDSGRGESRAPAERPRLNIAPRTKPVEPIQVVPESTREKSPEPPKPKVEKPKAADIFGAAKPVDTAAKEREIEKRMAERAQKAREEDEKEKQEREKERATNNNNNSSSNNQNRKPQGDAPARSWRDESREEKEKKEQKERKARSERRAPAQQLEDTAPVVSSQNKFAGLGDDDDDDQQEEEEQTTTENNQDE